MKKTMFVLVTFVIAILTLYSAFADSQECIDCCGGGPCDSDPAETPTLDIETCTVEINDIPLEEDVVLNEVFERGEDLEIFVRFQSNQDAEDVQVMVFLTGYHRSKYTDDISDMTSTFDIEANDGIHKYLELRLPDDFRVDSEDRLKIRIVISDKYSTTYIKDYNIRVEPKDHNIVIQDILLDPSTRVQAGRALFSSVRVRNMGDEDEESIKITTSIPALDVKATEYIDELEFDEATTSEDMFLRIPTCAEPGEYVVKVTVDYADGDELVTKQTKIEVTENPECQLIDGRDDKTVVTVPGRQDVIKGTSGTVYPIILENRGVTDRSYELSASGLDAWATYRFEPGTVVIVRAGEMKTAYLYITPKEEASEGEKVFMVNVETQNDQKQIGLTANVVAGEAPSPLGDLGDLKRPLEIGLIVLVVLLVVLGLVIGFSKMKGEGEEPDEISGQTYY